MLEALNQPVLEKALTSRQRPARSKTEDSKPTRKVKPMRPALLISLMVAASCAASWAAAATNYYKWTDEQGVTHYTARKPHNRDAEIISISTGVSTPVPAGSSTASEAATAGTQRPAAPAKSTQVSTDLKDPERCEAARKGVDVLRNNAKVRTRGDDGEVHYLTEEEKAEKMGEFEQAIREAC